MKRKGQPMRGSPVPRTTARDLIAQVTLIQRGLQLSVRHAAIGLREFPEISKFILIDVEPVPSSYEQIRKGAMPAGKVRMPGGAPSSSQLRGRQYPKICCLHHGSQMGLLAL